MVNSSKSGPSHVYPMPKIQPLKAKVPPMSSRRSPNAEKGGNIIVSNSYDALDGESEEEPSQKLEKEIVELKFKNMKATTYKGKILPATHPDSFRMRMISEKIMEALKRGLQKEQIGTDLNYTLEGGALMTDENVSSGDKWFGREQVWTDLNYASEGSGIYYGTVETIPYTKRKHIVLSPSQKLEKEIVELKFKNMKATTYKGKILPATHPDSVRMRMIYEKIMEALKRGLQKEQIGTDLNYTLEGGALMTDENVSSGDKWFGREQVWTDLNYASEDKWMRKDEALKDTWVDQSRKKGKDTWINLATAHLEGLDWEVLVVNDNVVKVECVPGGKIVVYTGLLNYFKTDEEIATIISHEINGADSKLVYKKQQFTWRRDHTYGWSFVDF
nr:peptidase M48 [Tanacetum cinerariifolium]